MNPQLEAAWLVHEKLTLEFEAYDRLARDARTRIARLFYATVQGQGTGPDLGQVFAAERLAAEAAACLSNVEHHIRQTFHGSLQVMNDRDPRTWTFHRWQAIASYLQWRPSCPNCRSADVLFAPIAGQAPEDHGQASCNGCGNEQRCLSRGYEVFDFLSAWHQLAPPAGV